MLKNVCDLLFTLMLGHMFKKRLNLVYVKSNKGRTY